MRWSRIWALGSLTFILGLMTSFSAFSQIQSVELKNLNANLQNHRGDVRFDLFAVESEKASFDFKDAVADVEKSEKVLHLYLNGAHLSVKGTDKSPLEILKNSELRDFQFSWGQNRFLDASFVEVRYEEDGKTEKLKNVNLSCQTKNKVHIQEVTEFLRPCFEKGRLTIPKVNIDRQESIMGRVLNSSDVYYELMRMQKPNPGIEQKLKKIRITTSNYQWKFRAKTKAVFNVKVKGDGRIEHDKEKKLLKVHVDKFKAGFINIKDKVLDAVAEKESENLYVRGDTIFLKLP